MTTVPFDGRDLEADADPEVKRPLSYSDDSAPVVRAANPRAIAKTMGWLVCIGIAGVISYLSVVGSQAQSATNDGSGSSTMGAALLLGVAASSALFGMCSTGCMISQACGIRASR